MVFSENGTTRTSKCSKWTVSDYFTRPTGHFYCTTAHGGTVQPLYQVFMSGKILVFYFFASNIDVECILEHFLNDYSQPDTWRNSIKWTRIS